MNWNFMNILMFFGIVQGFLLSVIVLMKKKGSKYATFFLAIMLFGLSMNLLYYFLRDVGITKNLPLLEDLYLPWPMLSAVCFYLYIVFSAPFQQSLTKLNKLAFAPFFVFSIIYVVIRLCTHFTEYRCCVSHSLVNFINVLEEYVAATYSLILGFLSYYELNSHEDKIQLQFSNYNISKLIFHRRFLVIMLIFCMLWLALYTYAMMTEQISTRIYYVLWVFNAIVLQWIALTGFIRDGALLPEFVLNEKSDNVFEKSLAKKGPRKIHKLNEKNVHYNELLKLFEKEEIYKDPNLSLGNLADSLGISKSYLSALINQVSHKNFYEFVNDYRVSYLINLFKTKKVDNYTILALAFEAGFNSKSTFQAAFKKITSKTPSALLMEIQNNREK